MANFNNLMLMFTFFQFRLYFLTITNVELYVYGNDKFVEIVTKIDNENKFIIFIYECNF